MTGQFSRQIDNDASFKVGPEFGIQDWVTNSNGKEILTPAENTNGLIIRRLVLFVHNQGFGAVCAGGNVLSIADQNIITIETPIFVRKGVGIYVGAHDNVTLHIKYDWFP
ncbi:hypothetical protein [Pseudovibrio ascidiaceicola]|uniref:hypothetical protein n=1 Tax=Pseudovibrio ascidiaceicola TaxID=285279 RepID=UPI000D69D0CE|nr:hypothetical protein [Pseudovibrio ascidiaceicola]